MSVLVDTNVWMDIALDREEFGVYSKGAIGVCLAEDIPVLAAATTLKDIFYMISKMKDANAAYKAVEDILEIAEVAPVDNAICKQALPLERPDYEGGIIAATALAAEVEAILTRDGSAFNELAVAKYNPQEFIAANGYTEVDF